MIRIATFLFFATASSGATAPALPAPHTISWDDFYTRVSTLGLEYSATLHELEGHRVRLRGFSIPFPKVPGGVLLSRNPYSDPHDVEETDVPYDAVGVLWRKGVALPPLPGRPTVEGTLRLGNHELGDQTVSVLLEDAVPVLPSAAAKKPR